METIHNEKMNIDVNSDHYLERESMILAYKAYLLHHKRYKRNTLLKCVDKINELDSSFPFLLITEDYLNIFCDRLYELNIVATIPLLNKIYTCKNYREMLDIFKDQRPFIYLPYSNKWLKREYYESEYRDKGIDNRLLELYIRYHELLPIAFNSEYNCSGRDAQRHALEYILNAMLCEAWINGEENFDYIASRIKDLVNHDIQDYMELRGMIPQTYSYTEDDGTIVTVSPFFVERKKDWATFTDYTKTKDYSDLYDEVYHQLKDGYENELIR